MSDELYILWTNADLITSEKMVCMYGHNAIKNGWWGEVTIIIWGAPAQLVAENKDLQIQLQEMLKDGVHISACKACTEQLGVTEMIKALGIEVKYWGQPLTEILKHNKKLLTV
ncbi:MAG: hypothetical protein WBB19_05905 [Desulforhopalus sp.]